MSSLSSASTDQDVWDSYDDNRSYYEDASTAKALAFVTACGILVRRRPENVSVGGESVNFASIEAQGLAAEKWLAGNRTGRNGKVFDYSNLRR